MYVHNMLCESMSAKGMEAWRSGESTHLVEAADDKDGYEGVDGRVGDDHYGVVEGRARHAVVPER